MREPWWLQYCKSIFLKMPIVTIWSVFQNQVTYVKLNESIVFNDNEIPDSPVPLSSPNYQQ